jgi:agmatine deiminase
LPSAARRPEPEAFRMPAEWDEHEATWLGWPHNLSDWPGRFAPIPWVYGEIVRKLAAGEIVRILVPAREHEAKARTILRRVGADTERVEFFRFPTDRGWTRDFGPICVRRAGRRPEVAVARFRFNGWAKYKDHRKDDEVPERAARALGLRVRQVRHRGRPVVLEGGAIDVNGGGTILTTEECLLDPAVQVRNPGFTREDYEQVFREELGARHAIWLDKGIAGDDTHGHVDDLCRFVGPRTIVLCRERDSRDANYRALEENRERLQGARLADGSKPEIVDLPMPAPLVFDGRRLPASYANFYVANAAVLVPTFNDPSDRVALLTLADLFRDRPVVGIHAVELVWGLGTLHCLTQQQPKA